MAGHVDIAALDAGLLAREAWLERATRRWGRLAHGAALLFLLMLYSNPQFWWPWFQMLRLAFVSAGLCAVAVVGHRLVSGERIRFGGWAAAPLWAYLAFIPASLAWTVYEPDTRLAIGEAWKMAVVFVAVQNVVDRRARLRRFLLTGAVASLGPALGSIEVWRTGDALVDGFRTHWRGGYADPNRLAMALVAVLPFALYGAVTARRRGARAFYWAVATAQLAAIEPEREWVRTIAASCDAATAQKNARTPRRRAVTAP